MSDLYKRVLTGIIGIILIIFIIYLGLNAIKVSIFILTLEAIRELHNAFLKKNVKLYLPTLLTSALFTFLFSFFNISLLYAIVLFFIINSISLILSKTYSIEEYMYTNFTYFYSVFLLNLLGNISDIYLIIAAFIISFSTDTFAYFIGSMFGKHKLIERVSPNKSIEGAIGGTVFSIVITSIYFFMLNKYSASYYININTIVIILLASISGQLGDLFASKIKRYTGIKDYSKLLPGHGGILDRFDSLIFISPFVYLLYFYI